MTTARLTLSTLAGALLLASPLEAQRDRDAVRQRIDTTFAFDANGVVHLGLVSGEIHVRGAATREIRIVASVERGRLETSLSRNRVSIESRSVNGRLGEGYYEITVPHGVRVSSNAVSGDVVIRDTRGPVTVATVSGEITVHDAADRVEVETVSGEADVARLQGRLRVESVSGDLTADEVTGTLEMETVSGSIVLRRSRFTRIDASSMSGDFAYEGPFSAEGVYRFNTHSGDVDLALPANAGADLDIETFSGDIESDFPLTLQPGESGGRRNRRMEFRIGAGGARISAHTFSGDITIRRQSARDNRE
ncbi:MAG TPA: DUF4097 family beta strand repeat-containing protein [Gemmatimonadaceae bacterium]|nr:DUF4097 family beta strand repeat-containing protein [Gemmatimonadaceae bacterium]